MCDKDPDLPLTDSVYEPAGVEAAVLTVMVELVPAAVGTTVSGTKAQDAPFGRPAQLSTVGVANPFKEVRVTTAVALDPGVTADGVVAFGPAMEKSSTSNFSDE